METFSIIYTSYWNAYYVNSVALIIIVHCSLSFPRSFYILVSYLRHFEKGSLVVIIFFLIMIGTSK